MGTNSSLTNISKTFKNLLCSLKTHTYTVTYTWPYRVRYLHHPIIISINHWLQRTTTKRASVVLLCVKKTQSIWLHKFIITFTLSALCYSRTYRPSTRGGKHTRPLTHRIPLLTTNFPFDARNENFITSTLYAHIVLPSHFKNIN